MCSFGLQGYPKMKGKSKVLRFLRIVKYFFSNMADLYTFCLPVETGIKYYIQGCNKNYTFKLLDNICDKFSLACLCVVVLPLV